MHLHLGLQGSEFQAVSAVQKIMILSQHSTEKKCRGTQSIYSVRFEDTSLRNEGTEDTNLPLNHNFAWATNRLSPFHTRFEVEDGRNIVRELVTETLVVL